MPDQNLDAKLRAFLDSFENDKAEGNTIANLRLEIHQVSLVQQEQGHEIQMLKLRQDRHGVAIRELRKRFESAHDIGVELDTGVHQVEDLRRHLAEKEAQIQERRDSGIWWQRKKREWAVAAAGALALATLGGFGTVVWFLMTKALGGK